MPRRRPPRPSIEITALIHQVGQESDQLRALIDTQGNWAAKCLADQSQCGQGYTSKSLWAMRPITASQLGTSAAANGPPPMWLGKMSVPQDFPLKDSPFVKTAFEFNSKSAAGRQRVQGMLFQCSAYEQLFDMTMQKYGAPPWLMAVVFQESACNKHAKSPVGAMGLWQFMPESGRAYGLKVVEDEVDERLNPAKSTDAAIHMLSDLAKKFGSWDLALAAYNLGPFALTVRLQQVGGKAGFWDLTDANLLPEETARYVPAIEAYAIILENRSRLGIVGDGPPLESTAEVIVKPGTRLSEIARAAHTSTNKIRELNPEFLHDDVPDGERSAVVPDSEAHRAQVFLDAPPNDDDQCVPDTFDWGRDHFQTSPYAASCNRDK